jgi:hypothetical protein
MQSVGRYQHFVCLHLQDRISIRLQNGIITEDHNRNCHQYKTSNLTETCCSHQYQLLCSYMYLLPHQCTESPTCVITFKIMILPNTCTRIERCVPNWVTFIYIIIYGRFNIPYSQVIIRLWFLMHVDQII